MALSLSFPFLFFQWNTFEIPVARSFVPPWYIQILQSSGAAGRAVIFQCLAVLVADRNIWQRSNLQWMPDMRGLIQPRSRFDARSSISFPSARFLCYINKTRRCCTSMGVCTVARYPRPISTKFKIAAECRCSRRETVRFELLRNFTSIVWKLICTGSLETRTVDLSVNFNF